MQHERADYGLDAPGVVRNLAIATVLGAAAWISVTVGLWTGMLTLRVAGATLIFPIGSIGGLTAIGCGVMTVWMLRAGKSGKVALRERLLSQIAWRGDERVLDVGCGRGLMLIGAAKRLTTGRATGIDIWQAEDLSGNRPDATLRNTDCEGVADRTAIETADMRSMPFPDATFDVVVSRAAIHNLYHAADRDRAIAEIARVLKPGGVALIDDIRHLPQYAAAFRRHGCSDVRRLDSHLGSLAFTALTFGSLRPGVLLVRKV